ncbi:MAG: hypothetical protein U5N85_19100 [Arcicella sp.]|nr:hypothetical protein [Arcicella sp.]
MLSTNFIIYLDVMLLLGLMSFITILKPFFAKKQHFLYAGIIIVPIVFFFFNIIFSTDNIPFEDDYVLLDSIYKMQVSTSFSGWLEAFLKQVNQHRFAFERTMMWLIYQIFGSENIKVQIIFGDLFLLGILYFFIDIFRSFKLSWLYFIPVSLLLFNYTYFENATWGIAAIQNTPIIFFALLTLYLLSSQQSKAFYFSILFAIITMFTSGNGLGIWIVGLLLLSFQKRWQHLGIWVLVAFCTVLFYFKYDYDFIPSDRTNLFKHPFLNVLFTLTFWGNVFYANIPHPFKMYRYPDILMCIFTGVFLLTMMLGLVWKIWVSRFQKYSPKMWFMLAGLSFLALTGLMLVFSRPAEFKVYNGGELLSRRYMIFGAVMLCLGYLSYLFYFQNNKKLLKLGIIIFLPLSLGLNIYSYYASIPDVYRQQQEMKLDGYYWKNYQMFLTFGEKYQEKMFFNHPTYMGEIINNLDNSGIYQLSQKEILPLVDLIKKGDKNSSEKFKGTVDTTMSKALTIAQELKNRVLFTAKSADKNVIYLGLKSAKSVFLLPAVPVINTLKKTILNQSYHDFSFSYEIWEAKFPADSYEVWLIEQDEMGSFKALYSKKNIILD